MTNLTKKTKVAFQRSSKAKIYCREKEIAHIKQFILSKTNILHICGNPGTGKTSTVFFVFKQKKYIYVNYLEEQNKNNVIKNINSQILKNTSKIIVIDEFDKLLQTNKKECLKLFDLVEQTNKKLITISNTLNISENILYFDAYTPTEINTIVKAKINDEVGQQLIDDKLLDLICKKYGSFGDIRKVFDYIKDLIDKKENTDQLLKINDIIENIEQTNEPNFHEKIVKNIINEQKITNKTEMYKLYYNECNKLNIQPLGRNEVYLLFDLHR